jgi:predicted RNase H-like HicB family nuclease
VERPGLKGCNSQRKPKEEALSNINQAIVGYMAALEENGLSVM